MISYSKNPVEGSVLLAPLDLIPRLSVPYQDRKPAPERRTAETKDACLALESRLPEWRHYRITSPVCSNAQCLRCGVICPIFSSIRSADQPGIAVRRRRLSIYFSSALICSTSSALISPTVVTSPSLIRHSRNGPVMSPYWSKLTGPMTPSCLIGLPYASCPDEIPGRQS